EGDRPGDVQRGAGHHAGAGDVADVLRDLRPHEGDGELVRPERQASSRGRSMISPGRLAWMIEPSAWQMAGSRPVGAKAAVSSRTTSSPRMPPSGVMSRSPWPAEFSVGVWPK